MQTHVAQLNLVVLVRIRSKAEFAILCLNSLTTKVSDFHIKVPLSCNN
jgi:hypothetical protein